MLLHRGISFPVSPTLLSPIPSCRPSASSPPALYLSYDPYPSCVLPLLSLNYPSALSPTCPLPLPTCSLCHPSCPVPDTPVPYPFCHLTPPVSYPSAHPILSTTPVPYPPFPLPFPCPISPVFLTPAPPYKVNPRNYRDPMPSTDLLIDRPFMVYYLRRQVLMRDSTLSFQVVQLQGHGIQDRLIAVDTDGRRLSVPLDYQVDVTVLGTKSLGKFFSCSASSLGILVHLFFSSCSSLLPGLLFCSCWSVLVVLYSWCLHLLLFYFSSSFFDSLPVFFLVLFLVSSCCSPLLFLFMHLLL